MSEPGLGSVHFGVVVKRCCSATCLASFVVTFTKHLNCKNITVAHLFVIPPESLSLVQIDLFKSIFDVFVQAVTLNLNRYLLIRMNK